MFEHEMKGGMDCTFDVGAPRAQAAGRAFAQAFARLART
jgi:hypothetical protein